MAISDWASVRQNSNALRARLFEGLPLEIGSIFAGIRDGQRLRLAREIAEEERGRRVAESGAFRELAEFNAGGPLSRQDLVSWLGRNAGKVPTTAAAGILHDLERRELQAAEFAATEGERRAAAAAAGVPFVPNLPASAYAEIGKRNAAAAKEAELGPILDAVRAGKPVPGNIRARFQEEINKEETALRAAAKQKADEESALEETAALEQMFTDREKMTPRQMALVTAKYQRERAFGTEQEAKEAEAREVEAIDAAGEADLPNLRVSSAPGLRAKQSKMAFYEGVRRANEAADRAEKSGDRADLAAALSLQQGVSTSSERALDEVAPRDPFSKQRVVTPGKEGRALELQRAIDSAAGRIADLQQAGPGGNSRMRELLRKGDSRTPEEDAEFLDLTGGR